MRREARATRAAQATKAGPESTRSGQGPSLLPIISVIAAVIIGVQVLIFASHAYQTIAFPYQLDYGEGPILQIALRVARGQALYPPISEPPYVIASYEPLYYLLSALGTLITGPGFLVGRLISLVSALVVAGCAGLIVWDMTKSRFASFLTAGVILAMPHFMVWSTLMRVDMMAAALAMAGYLLFTRGHRAASIPLFALGVFTRRTTVAAMGAAFIREARERGWRAASRAFVPQVALILALMGGAVLVTRGGMYHQLSQHTASSITGKAWSWAQVWSLIIFPLRTWPVYFAITGAGAIWCAAARERRHLFVFFAAACLVFLTSGRIGSAHNYLIEPLAVGAIMFGVMWADLSKRPGLAGVAVMALGGALAIQMVWTDRNLSYSISLSQERAEASASRYIVGLIEQAPRPVLCQDVGLIELAGKETPLEPFEFTQMARRRALDPGPVFRKVREGGYPLIITRFNPLDPHEIELHRPGEDWKAGRWPDGIIEGVVASYRLQQEVGPFFVFVPKQPAAGGAAPVPPR